MKTYFVPPTQEGSQSAFLSKFFLSLGLFSLLVITLGAASWLSTTQSDTRSKAAEVTIQSQPSTATCPTDKLQCLDGSVVTRDPHNQCLFTACPFNK